MRPDTEEDGAVVVDDMRARNELRADILKALANLTRVCIIEKLKEGPHNVGDLSAKLGEASSVTSRHLAVLKKAGLVDVEKQGTTAVYSMATNGIVDILGSVDEVILNNYERYRIFFASDDVGAMVDSSPEER